MNLRKHAPDWVRDTGRRASVWYGERTADRRPLPDFLVIGGQRCGTTSLFRALMAHPQIRRPQVHKGVNYFDVNYERGEAWYRGHFPARPGTPQSTAEGDHGVRVFDASGYYMFHPLAAARIVRDLPQVKVVAMVRDPAERAWSAYKHELARGFEWERSFSRAVELEDARLEGEIERMVADPLYQSFNHRHHAYRRRGEYAALLEPFVSGLGRERVHVLESERFFSDPAEEFTRLTDFLEVDRFLPHSFDRYNARPGSDADPATFAWLREHFASHDEALGALLGHPPVWRWSDG